MTNAEANRRAFIMEHEYFLSIVAAGCIVIMLYGYKSLWARYRQSKGPEIQLGQSAPPLKRTVSGTVAEEAEGNELNEKMMEWQKTYQKVTEAAVRDDKPEPVSDIRYSEDVEHLAEILMPGEKRMSYGEFLERKLDARDTLKPVRNSGKSNRSSHTTQIGRFC
jgi:hypothetical protein